MVGVEARQRFRRPATSLRSPPAQAGSPSKSRQDNHGHTDAGENSRDVMDRLLLRPAEAAEAIGVSRSRMYELLASGDVPSIRVGRTVRIAVAALQAWIAERLRTDAETTR